MHTLLIPSPLAGEGEGEGDNRPFSYFPFFSSAVSGENMMNCPECGKKIRDAAQVCPFCGYELVSIPSSGLQEDGDEANTAQPPFRHSVPVPRKEDTVHNDQGRSGSSDCTDQM